MISINPTNVLNLLWRYYDEFPATNVVTEREKSLSNVILTLIESTMVSSLPLPYILKDVVANHSSNLGNKFSPGLSSSPSSSSSYLDSTNFGYNGSTKLKETTGSSSFRSNITRTDSMSHANVKSPSTSSSGAIVASKARPAKPLRKSRVSPIQHSASSSTQPATNSVNVKSIGSSMYRKNSTDSSTSGHPWLRRGDSDLSRGVPPPITPFSRLSGMFSSKDKSLSMAVLPTSEDKCFSGNVTSTPRVSIFTRNTSSVASTSSSFRVATKTTRHFPSNNSISRNFNGRDSISSGGTNSIKDKNGSKDATRCNSQQQQVSSSSSVSSFSINGKNQPFSYSQPNTTVSSVANKLNQTSTQASSGKVSSTTEACNATSSAAAASVNIGAHSDVNCTNNAMSSSSSHGTTSSTGHSVNNCNSTACTPDLSNSINPMAKKKKMRLLKLFLRRRPTIDTLREKGIFKDEAVFGCHLANLCAREKTTVPKFLQTIIAAIERKDLRSDGIYRVCGNLSQVQKIRFQVNQDNYSGIWKEDDVHVLTGLLKMFFREMKDPIFPCSLFDSLMNAISITERKGRLEAVGKVVDSLAVCNFDTLKYLLQHLLRVKELSDDNRMHIQNLAIVFGPTLMWHETEKVAKGTSSNHSSVSSNNNSNSCTNNSPSSPSCVTSSSSMTPFTYGHLMNGINGSFAKDMLQKIKSNQLVEFLLTEFDSLFTRN